MNQSWLQAALEDFPGPVDSRRRTLQNAPVSQKINFLRNFYLNQKLAGKILSKQLSSRRNGCNLTKNPYLHSKVLTNEAEEAEEKRCRTGKTGKKRSVCNTCRGGWRKIKTQGESEIKSRWWPK